MPALLKVCILQYDVVWHQIGANLKKIENLLNGLHEPVDLILLPEMFATGFTMEPEQFSISDQNSVSEWMRKISAEYNTAILGSHPFGADRNYYNRLIFCSSEHDIFEHYDKRHLFSIGGEEERYSPGNERKTVRYIDWKIMPLICYDLRFPVWSRNDPDYDVLIYSANWPEKRNEVWEVLLRARAIENQAYVIGVNRIGTDGNKVSHIGNSMIISPKGEIIAGLSNEENYLIAELDMAKLIAFRKKFPVLKDRDRFLIQ